MCVTRAQRARNVALRMYIYRKLKEIFIISYSIRKQTRKATKLQQITYSSEVNFPLKPSVSSYKAQLKYTANTEPANLIHNKSFKNINLVHALSHSLL
jgi:hypothetical protein